MVKKKRDSCIFTRAAGEHGLAVGRLVCSKPLTKVTNSLPGPVIKPEMERHADHSAQQLASSSVAAPAYAGQIIKNVALKYGGRLNFVSGYI